MRINHGANVNLIALGAAIGGHQPYSEWLRNNHGASVHVIANGAAFGGHQNYAEQLCIKHGANVNVIALGATAQGLVRTSFANITIALHSLSFMTDKGYRAQVSTL